MPSTNQSDEPMPSRPVNPNPPPVMLILRILIILLGAAGIALTPTGAASIGLGLTALAIALVGELMMRSDEPMPFHPVNPPPPPRRLQRLISVLLGLLGLFLVARQYGATTGTILIGAAAVLNIVEFALGSRKAAAGKAAM
jgi:hypothetical protein